MEWTIHDIREANSEELEAAFGDPSREVILADLGRELYEALKVMSEPSKKHERPDEIWRKRDQIAQPALARYEREVADD